MFAYKNIILLQDNFDLSNKTKLTAYIFIFFFLLLNFNKLIHVKASLFIKNYAGKKLLIFLYL